LLAQIIDFCAFILKISAMIGSSFCLISSHAPLHQTDHLAFELYQDFHFLTFKFPKHAILHEIPGQQGIGHLDFVNR